VDRRRRRARAVRGQRRRHRRRAWALPIDTLAVTPACAGDRDGDAQAGIDELARGVGIALGGTPTSTCPAFDGDGDNVVSIAELITAVTAALSAC
jgi:hypothetical protein